MSKPKTCRCGRWTWSDTIGWHRKRVKWGVEETLHPCRKEDRCGMCLDDVRQPLHLQTACELAEL